MDAVFSDHSRVAEIGSASCRDDFKILRCDVCITVGGDVMLVIEALQVPPQRCLASIGECSKCPENRPVINPVELDRVRDREWEHQRGRQPRAPNVGHISVEPLREPPPHRPIAKGWVPRPAERHVCRSP